MKIGLDGDFLDILQNSMKDNNSTVAIKAGYTNYNYCKYTMFNYRTLQVDPHGR